jgi:hypothetical protein
MDGRGRIERGGVDQSSLGWWQIDGEGEILIVGGEYGPSRLFGLGVWDGRCEKEEEEVVVVVSERNGMDGGKADRRMRWGFVLLKGGGWRNGSGFLSCVVVSRWLCYILFCASSFMLLYSYFVRRCVVLSKRPPNNHPRLFQI